MKKREQCDRCGTDASVTRGDIRFDDVGLPIVLEKVQIVKCPKCKTEDPIIPDLNGLMHALAKAVVCVPSRLSGAEVKFLRTYTGKSSAEFAALLGFDKTTMSKIENEHRDIGMQADRLVRLLVSNSSPELSGQTSWLVKNLSELSDSNQRCDIKIDPATKEYEYV
jgi:DNA-binding transcriptional regulator YiaG